MVNCRITELENPTKLNLIMLYVTYHVQDTLNPVDYDDLGKANFMAIINKMACPVYHRCNQIGHMKLIERINSRNKGLSLRLVLF